jgi:hypothetical protein
MVFKIRLTFTAPDLLEEDRDRRETTEGVRALTLLPYDKGNSKQWKESPFNNSKNNIYER